MGRLLAVFALAGCYQPQVSDGDAAPTIDGAGGGGDGAVAEAPCGSIALLADRFTTRDPGWYVWSEGQVSFGGSLVLDLPQSGVPNYVGVSTKRFFEFRDGELVVDVQELPAVVTNAWAQAKLEGPGNDPVLAIDESGGWLSFTGGALQTGVAYDPAAHRFWRFREQGGTTTLGTSPDAVDFTDWVTTPTPAGLARAEVYLHGGYQGGDEPGRVQILALNGGTPHGAWCRTETFLDDFADGLPSDDWARSYATGGASWEELGGALELAIPAGSAGAYASATSSMGYDLRDSFVLTKVEQMLTYEGVKTEAVLSVSNLADDSLSIGVREGMLVCTIRAGGTIVTEHCGSVPFNPTNHRVWLLREASGLLSFETSPDGVTWTVAKSIATPFDVSSVNVHLAAMSIDALGEATAVRYAGLNVTD